MSTPPRRRLAELLVTRSYHRRQPPEEPFTLASGRTSWHYFECQRTTSHAEALALLAELLYPELDGRVVCVGGRTRGADPIADSLAVYSALTRKRPVDAFSVRKEPKGHGTRSWIEGSARPGDAVAVLEDVVTTGGSTIQAIQRAREAGLEVLQVLVLVDREEGGMERIRAEAGPGAPVKALFTFSELDALWQELNPEPAANGEAPAAVRLSCPHCGEPARVAAVQGDRCPGCNFEFKRFGPGERRAAEDYHHVLTGEKHLLRLPEAGGWVVAHE